MGKDTKKNSSNIAYSGKVKVQLYHGKKVYKTIKEKNSGKRPLFEFLANCLVGNFYSNQRPLYLRAYKTSVVNGEETGTIDQREEVTTVAVPVRRQSTILSDDSAEVLNEFLLAASTLTDKEANLLALFSFDKKNDRYGASAEVILETPIKKENGTSNVKVDWSLIIGQQS